MIYSIEFRLNKDNAQCKVYQTIMIKCIIKSVRNGESQTNHDKDVPNFTLEHYYLHRKKLSCKALQCHKLWFFFSDKLSDIVYISGTARGVQKNIQEYMHTEK